MDKQADSIEIECEIPVLGRLLQRRALVGATEIPTRKCGVIIKCRYGAEKLCDRSIIEAASETLEKILVEENENSDEVTLDLSEETLSTLMESLIGNRSIDFSQVFPLYAAAKRFGIHELSNGIKNCLSHTDPSVFLSSQRILEHVSDSDVPYISDLISGLELSDMDKALLCQTLIEWKPQDKQRDAVFLESISRMLSVEVREDEPKAPETECYLRAHDGQLLRVSCSQSRSVCISDTPRKLSAGEGQKFVIKDDFCIAIVDDGLEVRPLGMIPERPHPRGKFAMTALLGIDCSASQIIVWSVRHVFSITIEDGVPVSTLLKAFEFDIARVFAFEKGPSTGLAVLASSSSELFFYDSQMTECKTLIRCSRAEAVSEDILVLHQEGKVTVVELNAEDRRYELSVRSEKGTEVDFLISGSTIFCLSTVASGMRLSVIENGEITRSIVLENIGKRFVKVSQ